MKNQREIYAALLAGEKVTSSEWGLHEYVYFHNGSLVDENGKNYFFDSEFSWESYEIHREPKWYENIPDGGVLCWYSGGVRAVYTGAAPEIKSSDPMTKAEIQTFMDNAPEDL